MHHLYLMQVITYGPRHPIKIGVSKDSRRRRLPANLCPTLLGYFELPNKTVALELERLVCMRFPTDPHYGQYSHEILVATKRQILNFLRPLTDAIFIEAQPKWLPNG